MSEVFRTVLNMSITGGLVAVAVALLRLLLKRVPRWIVCALWIAVFLRFALPFSFSSPVSALGGVGVPAPVDGIVTYLPAADTGFTFSNSENPTTIAPNFVFNETAQNSKIEPIPQNSNQAQAFDWMQLAAIIWAIGAVGLVGISVFRYWKLKLLVRDAVFVEPGVYETDAVDTPFVIGFFRPRIILPLSLLREERELVLLHERAHIHRYDYISKPAAFLILAMHWFNPLAWLSYRLFCDDMEASCDERAIRECSREEIASYGAVLLSLGTQKAAFTFGPLAFGEHCTKERIVNVLNYKKPMFWVVAVAVVAAIATGTILLANPITPVEQAVAPTIKEYDLAEMKASDYDQESYEIPKTGALGAGANPSYFVSYGMDLSVLGDKRVTAETMAEFSNQLANGQAYIKAYLKKNATGCYDSIVANSKVDYVIQKDDIYSYQIKPYPHRIRVGKMYWHCSQQYVLMILHPESLHWQHYGYAQYLGSVLNPYDMMLAKLERLGVTPTLGKYVQYYEEQGGTEHKLTNDDYRLLVDSVAYYCLKNGMNWGTAYESYPITEIYGFTEPAEQGDDMSVMMASSFCAYLAEHYGFDRLTSYCSGQMTFKEAFHISFDRAYSRWQKDLTKQFS